MIATIIDANCMANPMETLNRPLPLPLPLLSDTLIRRFFDGLFLPAPIPKEAVADENRAPEEAVPERWLWVDPPAHDYSGS